MFNENLVRLRKINQMTQEDIAAAISKSQPYVSKTIRRFIEIVNEDFDSSKK